MSAVCLPRGLKGHTFNTAWGGQLIHWGEIDGHVWELFTVSDERRPASRRATGSEA